METMSEKKRLQGTHRTYQVISLYRSYVYDSVNISQRKIDITLLEYKIYKNPKQK